MHQSILVNSGGLGGWLPGARIGAQVLDMRAYARAGTLGIYLHCAKLREVDTTAVLRDALHQGAYLGGGRVGTPGSARETTAAATAQP